MAYTMTESPVDYDISHKYIRYRGLRKGSARSDYEAQVAPFNINYNTVVEQDTSRYKDLRQPVYPENVSSSSNTQVSSIENTSQKSLSSDSGKKNRRMGNIGYERLNEAQQEAYQELANEAYQSTDAPKESLIEDVDRKYKEDIRWNPAEIYDDYAMSPDENEATTIDSSHEAIPKDKPLSYGLPSNPRPDPHRRHPSMEQNRRIDPHHRNASVARSDISDTRRNPSVGETNTVNPYQRNPSVDRNGTADPHRRNPSASRNGVLDSYRRNPSIESNEISTTQKDPEPYKSQNSYGFSGVADKYQRRPSDSERKGSSSSQKESSNSRKGSTDSHKGGTISHSRGNSQTRTKPSIGSIQTSFSDVSRSGSRTAIRKVKITCDQISFSLAFTSATTAKDILALAKHRLGEGFDQKRYILVESYKQLGLERPLRHFECISDILDSWDTDDKDALLIQPFHAQWEYESLDLENAPKLVPGNMTANLYYSHRPESWHKWSFTLRVDGQIVMQKYSGGDYKAICHMNDLDIYIPTSRQMKKLAAPRKFCFALKSQQKAALSADNSNFVHFFSTNDKDVASEWYRAVHSWRSYYITQNKGSGPSSSISFSKPSFSAGLPRRNASLPGGNQRKDSLDKPLPELKEALTSNMNEPFDIRANPFIDDTRSINPNHNRSVSADRYGSSTRNRSQDPLVPTNPTTKGFTNQIHGTRRHHQVAKSDTVLTSSQNLYSQTRLQQDSHSFVRNGLPEHSQAMRKQSSEPPYSARAIVHPYSYGKPSVDLTRERKLSDDLNNGLSMADVPAPPEWKFDPYTGQPLAATSPKKSDGLSNRHDTIDRIQRHANKDGYSRIEPTDRKYSHEAVGASYAINGVLQQEHQLPYRNKELKGSIMEATQYGVYIPNFKTEAIHEITTVTGERFF